MGKSGQVTIAVVDNLPEGGAKRVVFEQIKWLANNFRVDYYTNQLASIFEVESYVDRLVRLPLTLPEIEGIGRIGRELAVLTGLLKDYQKIASLIKSSRAKVVICHPCRYTQAPMLLNLNTGAAKVYYLHEWLRLVYEPELFPLSPLPYLKRSYEWWRRRYLARIDYQNTQAADQLVTTSKFNQNNIWQAYKRESQIIFPGVDRRMFCPAKEPKRKYFLFVGNRDSVDGYDWLESARQQAPMALRIKVVALNRGKFSLSDQEMIASYQQAAAVLCLARNEPFGMTVVEAAACQTPVIARAEGGYVETVGKMKSGILLPDSSSRSLVEAMMRLSLDRQELEAFGRRGREGSKQFTWKKHGLGLLRLAKRWVE